MISAVRFDSAAPAAAASPGTHAAAQHPVIRAEEDYQRLRAAYLELAQNEHGHDVALAMVGADLERAHAKLQSLSGLRELPFAPGPALAMRRASRRMAEANS